MKENEEIVNILKANAFLQDDIPNKWTRNDWTIRFHNNEMEIYEDVEEGKIGRYLLTEIDADILKEILEDI